jgi:hypothetical protein
MKKMKKMKDEDEDEEVDVSEVSSTRVTNEEVHRSLGAKRLKSKQGNLASQSQHTHSLVDGVNDEHEIHEPAG